MKRYRLTESRLKNAISEAIKSILSEGRFRYKGFTVANISKDPSFPMYGIFSPEGEQIETTMFPSDLKEIVDAYLSGELEENKIRRFISEAIRGALLENDEFKPHGYQTKSNWGGTEVQISNNGDSARFRDNYGDGPGQPTDWLEIQFDEDGVAYVETPNGVERLDMYMRY